MGTITTEQETANPRRCVGGSAAPRTHADPNLASKGGITGV